MGGDSPISFMVESVDWEGGPGVWGLGSGVWAKGGWGWDGIELSCLVRIFNPMDSNLVVGYWMVVLDGSRGGPEDGATDLFFLKADLVRSVGFSRDWFIKTFVL